MAGLIVADGRGAIQFVPYLVHEVVLERGERRSVTIERVLQHVFAEPDCRLSVGGDVPASILLRVDRDVGVEAAETGDRNVRKARLPGIPDDCRDQHAFALAQVAWATIECVTELTLQRT